MDQYLTRNDREENHNHFFGFELWKDNQRSKFGCLHQMFFPEEHDGKTAQPLAFVQILIDGDMRPFACISFDKFDSLKKRLIELAKPSMNLETWENIPLGDLNYCPEEKKVMSNMWYIPFEDVCDVATVKMIDGDPVIHDFNNCSHELVTERLNLLKRCATLPDGSLDRLSNKELDDPNQEHMLTALLKSEDISLPDGLKLNH